MKKRFFLSIISFLTLLTFSKGQEYSKYGMKVNSNEQLVPLPIDSQAPDFNGVDQFGRSITLSDLYKDGPVLIVFYRGYWCPYCQKYLGELQEEFSSLASAGVQIIAVAPEVEQYILESTEKNNLEFSVLSDPDNKIMEAYNVAFKVTEDYQQKILNYKKMSLTDINGQDEAVLPIPATYLLRQDGTIKYVHFDINYKNRLSIEDILGQL